MTTKTWYDRVRGKRNNTAPKEPKKAEWTVVCRGCGADLGFPHAHKPGGVWVMVGEKAMWYAGAYYHCIAHERAVKNDTPHHVGKGGTKSAAFHKDIS